MSMTAVFRARDKVSTTMGKMNKSTEKLTSSFKKLSKVAAGSLAGIALAATGITIKAVKDFTSFDKSMREVWTLMPDMSEKAFKEMQTQVLDFSKEIKTLPEDVVPALYQSLSLGVPKGGVFDFLRIANKLAIGGVTELGTSVTSLRSIVKGLGLDISDTSKVSDILFTTMKLGATTIPELADSFPKVTAFAGNLGITIEELGASFAALTGVTGNTAEVSTQMRGLFSEMSKSGTVLSKTFSGLGKGSFKDFIKGGGSMIGALTMIRKKTDAAGIDFIDLFGSVEAGSAAMALTSTQLDKYNESLVEMGNSAGATDTAFSRMNKGIFSVFKRLSVQFKVAFIELGSALSEPIEEVGNEFIAQIPKMQKFFEVFLKEVPGIARKIIDGFGKIYNKVSTFFNYLRDNQETIKKVATAIGFLSAGLLIAVTAIALVNGAMAIFMLVTSPITLVVLGITAALFGLYKFVSSGALAKVFKATFGVIKLFIDSILFGIKSIINGIISVANIIPGINIPKFENEIPSLGGGLDIKENAENNGITSKDISGSTVNNTNDKSVNQKFDIKVDGIGQMTSDSKEKAVDDFSKMIEKAVEKSMSEDTVSLDY